jgi:hypothetical protein
MTLYKNHRREHGSQLKLGVKIICEPAAPAYIGEKSELFFQSNVHRQLRKVAAPMGL